MADKAPESETSTKQLTAAVAAKRTVVELVDGKGADGKITRVQRTKEVGVDPAEVLSFRNYGTHVVVVTRDGQKLTSEL